MFSTERPCASQFRVELEDTNFHVNGILYVDPNFGGGLW